MKSDAYTFAKGFDGKDRRKRDGSVQFPLLPAYAVTQLNQSKKGDFSMNEHRIKVRVCAQSKPRQTKTGKTMVTQDIVVDNGADKAPIVERRTYFDQHIADHALEPGEYTCRPTFYQFETTNAKGFKESRLCVALGDYVKAK